MNIQRQHGSLLIKNGLPASSPKDIVHLSGTFQNCRSSFGMTEEHLNKHTMLIGSTGCGKTTLMNKMIYQIQHQMTSDDVMIIFDSKGDFYQRFGKDPRSIVLGNSDLYYSSSVRWNIFKEILSDGANDDRKVQTNTQEICKNLFAERTQNTNNPFFPNAARDLLASLLMFILRTGYNDYSIRKEYFYNDSFKKFLDESDVDRLLNLLSYDNDARAVCSYIDGGGEQANGVLSEMYSVVRDIFTGVFSEHGGFSIRNFVRRKGGRTLFIEYDLSIGQVLTPVYRLLFDLALKEALSRQKHEGNVYLFMDEFRLVPHLQHIDDGVNFGRSLGVKVFAGLQNVEQLFDIYQPSRGRSILAGFSNLFLFHNDDPSTVRYLSERMGGNVVMDEYFDASGQIQRVPRPAHTVEDWDINSLQPGQAIVSLAFTPPFRFDFDK